MNSQKDPKLFLRVALLSFGIPAALLGAYTILDGTIIQNIFGFDGEILLMFGGMLFFIGIFDIALTFTLFKKPKNDDDIFE
ncbi:hypothetical protein N9Z27_02065 [Alphaproteobacteria bacterium]|nr:hypothetical protein [Alphaproteobacteria bacterium]